MPTHLLARGVFGGFGPFAETPAGYVDNEMRLRRADLSARTSQLWCASHEIRLRIK